MPPTPNLFQTVSDHVKYHRFPNTELSISQLCFGCWGVISDGHWGRRAETDSLCAMRTAVDHGVNFFDTAPMYGDGASESLLGRFLSDNSLRQQTIIATKIRPDRMRPEEIVAECDRSLKRLQTDYIDLYQTHWTSREVPLPDTWGAMLRLKEQGKVRYTGVCNMGTGDLADVIPMEKPLTNQLPLNLLWRTIESTIVPQCIKEEIGVLVYSPLMHGILSGNYTDASEVPDGRARTRHFSSARVQTRHGEPGCEAETFVAIDRIRQIAKDLGRTMSDVALAWTIGQAGVVSVIAGARNEQQVQDNVSFLDKPLSKETLAQLDEATEPLKVVLGSNPDMWDGGENSRFR